MSSVADGASDDEPLMDNHGNGSTDQQEVRTERVSSTQLPNTAASWRKTASVDGRKRGPQCDFILYRGNNAGGRCPRNGYHTKDGQLFCTNHYRLKTKREEKLNSGGTKRKRVEFESDNEARDRDMEELLASYSPEDEYPQEESKELHTTDVRVLDEPEQEKPSNDEMERRAEREIMKAKYKQKYKNKFRKTKKDKTPSVWDTFKYKGPRKTLNRAFKMGGGVSPFFQLGRE
jgi:hypothetical protein